MNANCSCANNLSVNKINALKREMRTFNRVGLQLFVVFHSRTRVWINVVQDYKSGIFA